MDWLRAAAVVSLLVVGIVTGGAAVRLVVAVGDRPAAATLGLVAVALVLAVVTGAHGRRWRRNPYW